MNLIFFRFCLRAYAEKDLQKANVNINIPFFFSNSTMASYLSLIYPYLIYFGILFNVRM